MTNKQPDKIKEFINGIIGLFIIGAGLWWWLSGSDEKPPTPTVQVEESSQEAAKPSLIPEINLKIAVDTIKEHPEVADAAVSQKGEQLSLSIILNQKVSEERAKELGDDFVRMVMTNAGSGFENGPDGKQIGLSEYSYLVGVYLADETQVVLGAKVSSAKWITW